MTEVQSGVAQVADAVWDHTLARHPYFRLRQGMRVETLPAVSLEEAAEDAAFARSLLGRLDAIDVDALAHDEVLTAQYLWFFLGNQAAAEDMWWTTFAVTPYASYPLGLYPSLLFAPHAFTEAADVDRYLSLVSDLAGFIHTCLERTRLQAERGWNLPAAGLAGITATWAGHRASYEKVLLVDADRAAQLDPAASGRLTDGVESLLRDEVLPAFDALLAYLTGPGTASATPNVGLSQYPGGAEAYARLVREHASYDTTPEEVHAEGLRQVESLTERMRAIRDAEGFTGDEAEYHERLRSDPRFYADTPGDVETTYRAHIARIEPLISQAFAILPEAKYDVERLDPALEAGMTFGYYEPPTGANAVGRYRYNGAALDTRSQLGAAAIIYHELLPGHHFHLARQSENTELPMLRRELSALTITAFTEGWAEYAADVAGELGCYADPWDAYGHLLHQRFLAQRLVVDTGMNALGWTLEQGRDYMTRMTIEGPSQVDTETLRYSTDIPGQALGYRLGFARLHELRARTREALGERFDIRDFHEQILGPGALPLEVLERHLEWYVARRLAEPASA